MEKYVKEYIEEHAKENEKEIYGWLIGYDDNLGNVYIIAAYDCQKYAQQTTVSAIPELKEFQFISSGLPQGIGVIGIYHSHPKGVFHSNIDDTTLKSLKKMYNNVISIVTNGIETKYFRFLKDALEPVAVSLQKIELKKIHFISIYSGNSS